MKIEYAQVLNGVVATLQVVIGMQGMTGKIAKQLALDLVNAALTGLEQVAGGLDDDLDSGSDKPKEAS